VGVATAIDAGEDGSIEAHEGEESSRRAERAWLRAAQAGSQEAMESLFRRHWPAAYRAACFVVHDPAAGEDIAQEAFMAAIRALDRFDRRRPFGPWLHRIVVNRAIDWARSRSLRHEVAAQADFEVARAGLHNVEPQSGGGPLSDEATEALASLSPEHRAVVVLRYLLDYTPGEIAEMLELPRGTVNSRLRRALDRLQGQLERPGS
jgi:RNA polymerase sigma-70 factor (ECF subfamily)